MDRTSRTLIVALFAVAAAAGGAWWLHGPEAAPEPAPVAAPEAPSSTTAAARPGLSFPELLSGTARIARPLPATPRPAAAPVQVGGARGAVSGAVLDPEGKPLPGATVRARVEGAKEAAAATVTAEAGTYVLAGLEEGLYLVEARAPGLRAETQGPVPVRAGEELRGVDFLLDKGERVLGVVLGPENQPIEGATVAARLLAPGRAPGGVRAAAASGEVEASALTAKDGTFEVAGLTAGRKVIVASATGFRRSAPVTVDVKAREAVRIELRLEKGVGIAGKVTLASGAPAPGVRVEARPEMGGGGPMGGGGMGGARPNETADAVTGDDGRYRIEGLAGRRFRVTAIPTDPALSPASRGGVNAGEENADLVLQPGATIAGIVVLSGSKTPVEGAQVSAGGDDAPGSSAKTDAEGRFEIGPVRPGKHDVRASAAGRAEGRTEVKVGAGQRKADVVVELPEGCRIEGKVVKAAGGAPLAGAVVRAISAKDGRGRGRGPGEEILVEMMASNADLGAWLPPGEVEKIVARNAVTDSQGRFLLSDLAVGDYRVYAAHAEHPGNGGTVSLKSPGEREKIEIALGEGGGIAGRVVDDQGNPRPEETVIAFAFTMKGRQALTNDKGEYEMKGVAPGSYFVTLGAEVRARTGGRVNLNAAPMGAGFVAKTANVEQGRVAEVNFGAEPKALVSGAVARADQPAKNETITFFPAGGGVEGLRAVQTDAEGRYEVDLMPGKYLARIDNLSENVEVPVDTPQITRNFRIPVGSVSGRVVNAATGEALKGARVNVYKGERQGQADTLAGALGVNAGQGRVRDDGAFKVEGLAPGYYTLTAATDGFALARQDGIEVPPDAEKAGVEIACEPGGVMRGRVVDGKRDPVPGAAVSIVDTSALDLPAGGEPPRVDEEGKFELKRFAPGRYRVTILSEAFAPWRTFIDFPGGVHEFPAIGLTPGGTLDLSVTIEGERPAPGALVELRYPEGDRVITGFLDFIQPAQPADALGRFRKARLPAGPLRGAARLALPGQPVREGSFEAVIPEGGEARAQVQVQ